MTEREIIDMLCANNIYPGQTQIEITQAILKALAETSDKQEAVKPSVWHVAVNADSEGYIVYTEQEAKSCEQDGYDVVPLYATPPAQSAAGDADGPAITADVHADAARYRWLRDEGESQWHVVSQNAGEYLDAAIDAAIKQEKGE